MAGGSANGNGAPAGDGDGDEHQRFAYNQWKKHAPLLYDLLYNHNLTHPSPCVRWGHVISEDSTTTTQRIYYSERGASPNTIVVANVKINKIGMSDPLKMDKYDENNSCPSITEPLRIETPDRTEVNKIYTFQQNKNLIVAKSDLSQLHIFDVTQGSSRPAAMTLSGHSPDSCESNFALDTSSGSTRCERHPTAI
ncbi:hypothetical protein T484DRAFT_1794954 [Baffinella frigidus]|nr:hypothetical protein T484DRAFT_1794954 [Cryptophyta sp. CCMP2293]